MTDKAMMQRIKQNVLEARRDRMGATSKQLTLKQRYGFTGQEHGAQRMKNPTGTCLCSPRRKLSPPPKRAVLATTCAT